MSFSQPQLPMARAGAAAMALVALVASAATAGGPVTLGISAGGVVAGKQDIKVLQYTPAGAMTAWEHLNGTSVDGGPFASLELTFWPPTRSDKSAFRVELDAWRVAAGIDSSIVGRTRVVEERLALIASWVVRLPMGAGQDPDRYAYLGAGGGAVLARISADGGGLGPAFSAVAGFRTRLGPKVGLHVEMRLAASADVDARHHDRLQFDVSGAHGSRLPFEDAHLDANFVPITVGIDWRL